METTPEDQHSHHDHQDNPNEFRSMRNRMHPPRMSAPSCIVPPIEQLVIRPHIVPLLPTFHGMESENPYAHIKEFEDKAKIWLNSLRPRSIRSWTDLQAKFLKKFFPTHRTNSLKRQISNFSAKEKEKFYECWERYKEAINACPHHGFDTWLLVIYFYDGMSSSMKQLLETIGEVGKMKSQPNALHAKAGMYTLNEDVEMKAKFAAMMRRLEELELKKMNEVQAVAETPVQLLEKCLENKQMSLTNSSSIAIFIWQYLELKLENHPNFSWKPRAPQYQQPTQPSQPSQQASSLEQAIVNLSKEKGRFPSQPHQNPRGITRWKLMRENLHRKKDRDSTVNANPEKELIKEELMKKRTSPPFPHALHGKKGIKNASEILEVLSQVKVNIPLLDMIKQVPSYAKFLKDLCTIKKGLNVNKKAFLTEQVSAIIQCKSPLKYKDPGCPTISVMIGGKNGLMQLTFGNMTLELNIFHMSKKLITPEEEEGPEEVCIIDTLVEEHCNKNMQDELNESLEDLEEGLSETVDVLAILQGWRRKEEILPLFNKEEGQDDVKEEFPKLNLKPLPMELKYTYLEENNQCPVVISSSLTGHQEISLLEVLKRCKKAI
ncbi:hypothetical protein CK203_050782 [Vitis vinifera]|uniref:Retrotransposon gag domain-containing protein n=1 Tax=Vitis vinifera TaxID=29760 RepID=A0A438HCW9_VITVI|nr:hypothetical protein CK203_050782 [Vitis vinifera]